MDLNTGQWAVIGLSAVLIFGYIWGNANNQRRAEVISRWLHDGLSAWGAVTSGGRLGGMSSGGRLRVERAAPPFTRIDAVFLLEPRENLLFWLITRLQGRRDLLMFSIDFRSKPLYMAEAGAPDDRDFRRAVAAMSSPEKFAVGEDSGLQIVLPPGHRPDAVDILRTMLRRLSPGVRRVSVRYSRPHLILRGDLSDLQVHSVQDVLKAVAGLQQFT